MLTKFAQVWHFGWGHTCSPSQLEFAQLNLLEPGVQQCTAQDLQLTSQQDLSITKAIATLGSTSQ